MVNVAEEVESPERNLPAAILTALLLAGGIYIAVVSIATSIVPPETLAESDAPLLEVVHRAAPAFPMWIFTLIALFAVANTGLLNCIMGSRLLYGMAEQRLLPHFLSRVNGLTQTPHWAIVTLLIAGILLAFSGTLAYLAGTTSVLLLIVFATVNVSLVVVKWRQPEAPDTFRVPLLIPILGGLTCLILIRFLPPKSLLTASGLFLFGLILVLARIMRRPVAPD
jgi:amino acid transporter